MKYSLFFLLFCAASMSAVAQQDCFDDLFAAGKANYDACNCDKAAKQWKAALGCPDIGAYDRQKGNEWLAKAKRCDCKTPPKPIRPSYEPEMINIQGGTFEMGDVMNDNEQKNPNLHIP